MRRRSGPHLQGQPLAALVRTTPKSRVGKVLVHVAKCTLLEVDRIVGVLEGVSHGRHDALELGDPRLGDRELREEEEAAPMQVEVAALKLLV